MPSYATSGASAITTSSDTAVEAIAASSLPRGHYGMRIENGAVAGWWSPNGGTSWLYMKASMDLLIPSIHLSGKAIQVKRIASGSNLANVFVNAWSV
jgi:hypothetical protein